MENKKLSEEELDRLLEEQFLKEYQFIEEGLSFDESGTCYEESDEEIEEAYEKLTARLRTEGVYREESVRHVRFRKRSLSTYKVMKAAGIGIVCALGVCSGAMNNKTNNTNFVNQVKMLVGSDTCGVSDSREEDDKSQKDAEAEENTVK